MSTEEYWAGVNRALLLVLADRSKGGRHIKLMSYHPPAHVQSPKHVTNEKVMRVHRQFAEKRARIALRGDLPFLSQGDSNIDPQRGWKPKGGWDFMFGDPLTYLRPKSPTHGQRTIDEFMARKLKRVGAGSVLTDGPSDHRPILQVVRYA